MTFRSALLIILLGMLCLAVIPVFAQNGTGSITGHVTDSQGALVPKAQVTATNVDTGVHVGGTTNSSGIYELLDLIPGTYSVEVAATSFKKVVRPNILVQVEDRVGLDFRLDVGSINETITVTAASPQLRTEDAQLGEVVTEHMIETLPQLQRDPLQLLTLSGNVQGGGARAGWSLGLNGGLASGFPDTRVNGGRPGDLEYLVDGVPATGGFAHNVVNDTPTMEDVAEFAVITNGASAEYGRLSGGAVSVTTKSGSNKFHGQLFEYHQDSFLDANTWNNDALCAANPKGNATDCVKPNFRQNDFGFAFGGPVILPHIYNGRNKTFFFVNYEGLRNSTAGNPIIGQTISDQERASFTNPVPCPDGNPAGCADLTDIGNCVLGVNGCGGGGTDPYATIYDPFGPISTTTSPDPDNGAPEYTRLHLAGGDGRHIPINELDPLIQKYVALMPLANNSPIPGTGTGGNFVVQQPNHQHTNVWSVRVDQVINDKQRIFGRFTHNNGLNITAPFYPSLGTSTGNQLRGGFGGELHYDYALSPTLVMELHVGGNYSPFSTGSFLAPSVKYTNFPYGSTVQQFLATSSTEGTNDLVRISQGPFNEGSAFGCNTCQYSQGFNTDTGAFENTTNFQYAGSLTKILKRHTLKFGYEGRRYYDNFTQDAQSNQSANISDGYAFDSEGVTQYIGNNGSEVWTPQGYSNGVGQFLFGVDSWIRLTDKLGRSLASNYYASYVQDDFKVNRKLTLNLGVRWEMETPVTERNNNLSVWDPSANPGFYVNPGYSWTGALQAAGLSAAQIAEVQTPAWVNNGFAPGAIRLVATPEHPSRNATMYHPWNFSPRLGFAYAFDPKTVVRGSFAMMYLPTSGNLSTYGDTPGVSYVGTLNNQSTQGPPGPNTGQGPGPVGTPPRTVENPFDPTQNFPFIRNNLLINQEAADSGSGVGAMDIYAHMPHEFDWSLGIQRQLPHNWLVEADYSANSSNSLLTVGNPSHFPKNLYVPQNAALYNTVVASPTAGQVANNSDTGPMQPLGILEYLYPYYGPAVVEGLNYGSANFESGNLRVQRRFADGFQMLFNYTYSKALDDTGGSDTYLGNPGAGAGSGGKPYQQVDSSVSSVYGLSPNDETHRISAFYNYQLPFGQGRKYMSSPSNLAGNLLQAVAGGWEISGQTTVRSGRPIYINVQGQNADQSIYIKETFGSLAPGDTLADLFNGKGKGATAPQNTAIPVGSTPYYNLKALANGGSAQSFTYGDLPPAISTERNPGFWATDISVMKSFPILSKDGSRYLQLRLEGQNIFNHPGRGDYDASTSDATFGYILNNAVQERHVQISGRFVF
jgi:hypothetical protein